MAKTVKKSYQDKTYRLADSRSGESFMLKTGRNGNLTVYDEEMGVRRPIRHCPNQKTAFRDEQDDYALVTPIIFTNGFLQVKATEPVTQQFLDLHPANVANGGQWFESVDDEKQAKESIAIDELKVDLKYLVRQKAKEKDGIHALKAEVAVVLNSVEQAAPKMIEELKQVLYNEIEADPFYFADEAGNPTIFDNDETLRKYLVLKAIKDGVIKKSPNNKSIIWGKSKETIATAPVGVDLVDYFTSYLSTDEGILVLEEMTRRS